MSNAESNLKAGYHDALLVSKWKNVGVIGQHNDTKFTYQFHNFFHPYVGALVARLNKGKLEDVLNADWQQTLEKPFFNATYQAAATDLQQIVSSPLDIDTEEHGPYANYNWELFYHLPLAVAVHLSKTRRFAEAQRWFHFIFDPTSNDKLVAPSKRCWNFLGFRKDLDPKQIDELLTLLSKPSAGLDPADLKRQQDILNGYQAMLDKPFMPHAVARTRHSAYQYSTVMKYLDNLLAWGDHLFQAYTVETINEALMHYVLAANILGRRPEQVPDRGTVKPHTFADLKAQPGGFDRMGNTFVTLESQFPLNASSTAAPPTNASGAGPLFGIGRTLYFCIPRNEKLLAYWDLVEDRLFKIRHCMTLQGVVTPLALFDPPIDPGMLVAAAAAGMDIGSIVSGLNQPAGPARSALLIQKALELCSEVRSLGGALLAAFEKGDAEQLSLMRQAHEIQIQKMSQDVRFLQWKASEEASTSLLTMRASLIDKLRYFQRQLGLPADANAPDSIVLKRKELTEENFATAFQTLVAQYDKPIRTQALPPLALAAEASPAQQSGAAGGGRLYLNKNEDADLNIHGPSARGDRKDAMTSDMITGVLALIPDMGLDIHFWGLGGHANVFGGSTLASVGRFYSSLKNFSAADHEGQGSHAVKTSSFERRADDQTHQYNLAAHELMQNGRQILSSLIAEQTAHREYLNVQQQIENAQGIEKFLNEKFSNKGLHLWMQGELSRLFYEYYRFAFDTARKAELAMKRELMRPELDAQTFVRFNYWDAGRKGLLCGEALHLDVKRMELAAQENNKRELELTRHVSLRQLDPLALLKLKGQGTCIMSIPEWLYDRDCPQGHYLRRIKSVALSIPSVVGPYTSLNCTLTLVSSSIRKSTLMADGEYARQGADDSRFADYAGGGQQIVTSGGSNDSGLFETNLRDERYLPFEGAGAVSTWKVELPKGYPAFDLSTISDLVLHVRYTARQGVDPTKVAASLKDTFEAIPGANFALLFSLRHDFPVEWSQFTNGAADFGATVTRECFPYFTQGKPCIITSLEIFGPDLKHRDLGGAANASADLADKTKLAFTVSAAPDAAGPLARTAVDAFLIVRYALG
ncbi:insecticidal toxin protein [Massilia sp. PWRC2]|uniref:Tc toxin subunit A-related protein n=1 Tax=Massilia sp. PWRC2 TaxID=2804626 RepID=UPI003CFA8956